MKLLKRRPTCLSMLEKIIIFKLSMGKRLFPDGVSRRCNGYALLEGPGKRRIIGLANIVTNDGDQYYAEAAVGAPSWTVAGVRLGTSTTAPTKADMDVTTFLAGSGKAMDGTYPMTNDTDADNAAGKGIDVVSWRISFGTAEGNGTGINELALVDNIVTPTKALTHALFEVADRPFNKTSSDTLKVFINHTMNGV